MLMALSLWEPWASAMRKGLKRNETRGWFMGYRGDLVICAAKTKNIPCADLRGLYQECLDEGTFGNALCVVEVYECVPTKVFMRGADRALLPLRTITEQEWSLGDYGPNRFAIMTRNLRPLQNFVPVRGKQSIFALTAEEEAAVRAQISNPDAVAPEDLERIKQADLRQLKFE